VTEKRREEDQSSLDWINEPAESWLVGQLQRETRVPLNAFERLCEKCDRNFLVWHFATLATPSFEPDPLPKEFEHLPQKPRGKVQMFPLDSWFPALISGRGINRAPLFGGPVLNLSLVIGYFPSGPSPGGPFLPSSARFV